MVGVSSLNRLIRSIQPSSLKYRLFFAFLLLIILPFFALQVRNHTQVERLYEYRISEQSQNQLDQMKQSFEQIKSQMLLAALQLEKESTVQTALKKETDPGAMLPSQSGIIAPAGSGKEDGIVEILTVFKNRMLPVGEHLHYSLTDLRGHLYVSYEPKSNATYGTFMEQPAVKNLLAGQEPYAWVTDATNDMQTNAYESSPLISLYMVFKDEDNHAVGLLRVGFAYQGWLKKNMSNFLIQQDYYILNETGRVVYESRPDGMLPEDIGAIVKRQQDSLGRKYEVHEATSSIINSSYIGSMNWYLIAQFPLEVFFGDIRSMNQQFFITFGLFTLLFIIITFFILSTITRPLMLLKKKMSEIIVKNFLTSIPTDNYKGEILEIAVTFNNMAKDLTQLVDRLKVEERQKEAIRFQMLLQQMNPHFLLNTLNTIKWNVLSKGDQASADICISLGKLLETSLNSEADLIHLHDELELIEAYAAIQNFRYDQRFEVRYEYEDSLRYALVPKLSLQPLVENAIQHGLAKMKTGGCILIRIYTHVNNRLILEVEDNGAGLSYKPSADPLRKRSRIGLKNLKERLQLLFRTAADLELIELDRGALARMSLPLLISPPYEHGGQTHVEDHNR